AMILPTWAAEFQLNEGDRVVLLGNTLIEREQKYGYWETMLTARHPDKNIIFRNLGWSGDTVFGHARAGFGSVADGFRHLKDHVLSLKPTVIILGYGLNESFEGEAGLPRFLEGLKVLLDTLAPTKAQMAILSPLRLEDLGRPLPEPVQQNKNIRLYRDALRKVAGERGFSFVDLYTLLGESEKKNPPAPLTDNGIHMTEFGYWKSAAALEQGLGLASPKWRIEMNTGKITGQGVQTAATNSSFLSFQATDGRLPNSRPPKEGPKSAPSSPGERVLIIRDLPQPFFSLAIDGQTVAEADSADWAKGVVINRGPEFDQVEKLRAAIIEKNRHYFYRWRPQNETYLFGFRKHEQGQNAREIPQFDPLVEKLEKEIAKLRVPGAHQYVLKPIEKGK
ncbi:MAG TPA: SGNH/GDSL hydrolase family protein, partial [Gemmataceae bacterium]|nr:SGNH/GDSL hydrolase family protein [Gemmataceae bacterium]